MNKSSSEEQQFVDVDEEDEEGGSTGARSFRNDVSVSSSEDKSSGAAELSPRENVTGFIYHLSESIEIFKLFDQGELKV